MELERAQHRLDNSGAKVTTHKISAVPSPGTPLKTDDEGPLRFDQNTLRFSSLRHPRSGQSPTLLLSMMSL